jgi:rod shape-determining protein MreC
VNLRFEKKNLIYILLLSVSILFLSCLIPAVRPLALNILKFPLNLLVITRREAGGIIFYHQNLIYNERLRREADFLKRQLNAAKEFELENNRLKDLLSLKQKAPYKVIAASVLGRSPDNWSSVIIIDKGSLAGIKRGFVALNYLGLVGRVVEVSQFTSKILLLNDPNLSVSAQVQRSRQEGAVSGTLGTSLIMRYLPKDADVQISDVIITSGLAQLYPKGLLIGTVVDIGEEFSRLSRYCIIKPAVNLSNIEEVLIIIP